MDQNYSPLAYFSSLTLTEHNQTLQHLQTLQDDIVAKRQLLLNADREAVIEHDARLALLIDEENQVRMAIERCDHAHDKFRILRENDEAQLLDDLKKLQGDVDELVEQLRALDDAENELRRMQQDMADRYQGLADRRREFVRRFEQAASEIEGVRQTSRNVGMEVSKLEEVHSARSGFVARAASPLRHTTNHGSVSLLAAAAGGGISSRTLSPTRRGGLGVSFAMPPASSSFSSSSTTTTARNQSPSRNGSRPSFDSVIKANTSLSASTAALINAAPSASVAAVLQQAAAATSRSGSAAHSRASSSNSVHQLNSTNSPAAFSSSQQLQQQQQQLAQQGRLVALCSAGDVEAALKVLGDFPGEVNTIDACGNTPLHAACASSIVSLPLVTQLLLAGASTSAKNDDGLTPFHLAALNTSDHGQLTGHRLKRHLIYKAAVSPNQRTSKGETAAHLCAMHDRHLDSLRFLVGSGLDLDIKAVSPSPQDGATGEASRPITCREKAQRCGSAKTMEFLEQLPR